MAADSQNSDDSGKVYDFKDSKTSGVVAVTKNWDDSLSNDERPVPDVLSVRRNLVRILLDIPSLIMEMD